MLSKLSITAFTLILAGAACKSTSPAKSVVPIASPDPIAQEVVATPLEKPSVRYEGAGELVITGSNEGLVDRGPNAQCPSAQELDRIEKLIIELGQETLDLVKEDIAHLRLTIKRTDKVAIESCCNQMEQLVQDIEIMNEDKPSAAAAVEKIQNMTLKLCTSGSP